MPPPTLFVPGSLAGMAGEEHPDEVPIDYIIGVLRNRMKEFGGTPQAMKDRVWIIRSETGSGKSTALPAEVFRLLRGAKTPQKAVLAGPGVICTQPRVLTAISLAREMAASPHYPDLELGVTVGYATGPINEKPERGLIYATAGSLLAQLRGAGAGGREGDAAVMDRYRFILVDEAHEASLDIILLLLALKNLLRRNLGNPRLPFVLLTSATINVAKYSKYFGVGPENVIEVTGRAYGIATHYPLEGTTNYPEAAARTAVRIHRANPGDPPDRADILIFMPGLAEIEEVVKVLTEENRAFRAPGALEAPYLVLAISGEEVEQEGTDFRRLKIPIHNIRLPSAGGEERVRPMRKIIVSTVVAETGLTLEALKYVIDCGWNRTREAYFPGGEQGIVTRPAPKSRIRQRKGRAGRLFPGEFYPLYTQEVFEALEEDQLPDMVVQGLSSHFLPLVQMTAGGHGGVFRVGDIDLLDAPPVDALASALEAAVVFGYLRASPAEGGHALTPLGETAAGFAYAGMEGAQTLIAGYLWGVSILDLALVVALYGELSIPFYALPPKGAAPPPPGMGAIRAGLPAFLREGPESLPEGVDGYWGGRLLLSDDFLEGLLAFEGFARALLALGGDPAALSAWCFKNGLDYEKAVRMAKRRDGVIEEALRAGLNPFWGYEARLAASTPETFSGAVAGLKMCIYAGLRRNLLVYDPGANAYRGRHGGRVGVPPPYTAAPLAPLGKLGADVAAHKPKKLVTNQVVIRKAPRGKGGAPAPLLYGLVPALVSVLAGFVPEDENYWAPRCGGGQQGGAALRGRRPTN